VPDGFDLRAVSGDLVVGLEHDALDVEHVRVYRIETRGSLASLTCLQSIESTGQNLTQCRRLDR
jgi:hypothetical protein